MRDNEDLVANLAVDLAYLRDDEKRAFIFGVLSGLKVSSKYVSFGIFKFEFETMRKLFSERKNIATPNQLLSIFNLDWRIKEKGFAFDESVLADSYSLGLENTRNAFFNGFDMGLHYLMDFASFISEKSSSDLAQTETKRWGSFCITYIFVNYI